MYGRLNACRVGCLSGNMILNHLMYMLMIWSYSGGGMQSLLKTCFEYGCELDIKLTKFN